MQMTYAKFPNLRMRRLRQNSNILSLVQENNLETTDLIWPIFLSDETNKMVEIKSMPGVYRYSLDGILKQAEKANELNIPAIAIFPKISDSLKDEKGSEALNSNNLVCNAVKKIKLNFPDLLIVCDVALDPYTQHGHDGILINNKIDNDETNKILSEQSLILADSGCDIIAPSDMMDGRIKLLRQTLEKNNFKDTIILSYAAKFASSYYNPFRNAINSGKNLGESGKRSYQMNPANSNEAINEIALDINEGADIVMIKPCLPYLDIIYMASKKFTIPCFAYQVSGEYSMIMAGVNNGWIDKEKLVSETLLCIKRAGARAILTYFAPYIASEIINRK